MEFAFALVAQQKEVVSLLGAVVSKALLSPKAGRVPYHSEIFVVHVTV